MVRDSCVATMPTDFSIDKPEIAYREGDSPLTWFVQASAAQESIWVKPTAHALGAGFPPELTNNLPPRRVKLANVVSNYDPMRNQWLMLLFPCVWWMCFSFFNAVTVDHDLLEHGRNYDALITNVKRWSTEYKSSTINHTEVTAAFKAGGKTFTVEADMHEDNGEYKKGRAFPIRALPSHPGLHEPMGSLSGTVQATDLGTFWVNLCVNIIMEVWIWSIPVLHRRLAKNGLPVLATISELTYITGINGVQYSTAVDYTINSVKRRKWITIDKVQYDHLKKGSTEIMLYDPEDPNDVVFYKFCYYHPVLLNGS